MEFAYLNVQLNSLKILKMNVFHAQIIIVSYVVLKQIVIDVMKDIIFLMINVYHHVLLVMLQILLMNVLNAMMLNANLVISQILQFVMNVNQMITYIIMNVFLNVQKEHIQS